MLQLLFSSIVLCGFQGLVEEIVAHNCGKLPLLCATISLTSLEMGGRGNTRNVSYRLVQLIVFAFDDITLSKFNDLAASVWFALSDVRFDSRPSPSDSPLALKLDNVGFSSRYRFLQKVPLRSSRTITALTMLLTSSKCL